MNLYSVKSIFHDNGTALPGSVGTQGTWDLGQGHIAGLQGKRQTRQEITSISTSLHRVWTETTGWNSHPHSPAHPHAQAALLKSFDKNFSLSAKQIERG
jgi:hypothetical protein